QMAETADAEHGDDVTRPGAAVAKRIEGGDARAHQRRRLDGRQPVRDRSQRAGGRDQVVGIAAVVADAGNLERDLAGDEVAAAGAMSCGWPMRPRGIRGSISLRKSPSMKPPARAPSVSTTPGLIAFTLMLRDPSSAASVRVIESTAALVAL